MVSHEIKNLKELIEPVLLNDGKEYVSSNVSNLTSNGDNYASLMLSIDITTKNKKNAKEEEIHTVAKLFPPNELLRLIFNSPVTFRNELGFYQSIAPAIKKFQTLQGITETFNAYPKLIAGRLNLKNTSDIDDNALIILNNIKYEGYKNIEKSVGFDLTISKMILKKIAEFHASTFAMEKLNPELFNETIRPFLGEYELFNDGTKKDANTFWHSFFAPIEHDEEAFRGLKNLFDKQNLENQKFIRNSPEAAEGKFITLTHQDLWANNIMVKFQDDTPIDIKFVDFQLYEINSIASDLMLFLTTSVELSVLQNNFDYLIRYYYDNFIEYLDLLSYKNVAELTYENFLDEISMILKKGQVFHFLIMLVPIFATPENTKALEEMEPGDLVNRKSGVSEKHKQRATYLIREFLHRKWI